MRKHIQSWLVTFAVIFASSMGFHACGSDAASIFLNLGELPSQLGSGGGVTNIAGFSSETCGEQCDGVIPEMYEFSIDSPTLLNSTEQGVDIYDGTTTFSVVTSGEDIPAADAQASLIAMINDATEGSDAFTASAGSIILTPFNNLQVPNASIEGTSSGETPSVSVVNDSVRDTQALTDAITSLFGDAFSNQDLVDQAVTDDLIDDASTETREVALAAHQMDDCDTGTARLDQAIVVEIDGDEIVTDEFYRMETVTFINCVIAGNWLANGGDDETVTFNGSITSIDLVTDTEDRSTANGTILIDAQDSMSMPFWVDRLNINTREVWDNTAGPGPDEISGGICYGGNVQPDTDNTTDTGDTCTGDGTFVSATDFSSYAD